MNSTLLIIIAFIFLFTLLFVVISFNRMIRNKNRMNEAWSIIDVFLKKRYDLIPALVETVKGYAAYEKSTLEEVVRIRSQAIQEQSIERRSERETQLDKALVRLFVVVENYPDLKTNQRFLTLQQQISQIENDLEKSRRYYNGTVRVYNIQIEEFPANIIAGLFHFRTGSFFQINREERMRADISFN